MALRIRLQRGGRTHNPVYRVVVAEASARRDGRFVEVIGHYSPKARGQDVECALKLDRLDYWMGVGAEPSETMHHLIRKARRQAAAQPEAVVAE